MIADDIKDGDLARTLAFVWRIALRAEFDVPKWLAYDMLPIAQATLTRMHRRRPRR